MRVVGVAGRERSRLGLKLRYGIESERTTRSEAASHVKRKSRALAPDQV